MGSCGNGTGTHDTGLLMTDERLSTRCTHEPAEEHPCQWNEIFGPDGPCDCCADCEFDCDLEI